MASDPFEGVKQLVRDLNDGHDAGSPTVFIDDIARATDPAQAENVARALLCLVACLEDFYINNPGTVAYLQRERQAAAGKKRAEKEAQAKTPLHERQRETLAKFITAYPGKSANWISENAVIVNEKGARLSPRTVARRISDFGLL